MIPLLSSLEQQQVHTQIVLDEKFDGKGAEVDSEERRKVLVWLNRLNL